jgi:hypothetical protein
MTKGEVEATKRTITTLLDLVKGLDEAPVHHLTYLSTKLETISLYLGDLKDTINTKIQMKRGEL